VPLQVTLTSFYVGLAGEWYNKRVTLRSKVVLLNERLWIKVWPLPILLLKYAEQTFIHRMSISRTTQRSISHELLYHSPAKW